MAKDRPIILENRYKIAELVGKGNKSEVYKAYDLQAENAVRAIKKIKKSDTAEYETAMLESKLIKELYERDISNAFFPNIIQRVDNDPEYFYIVQDYLDGQTMKEMLDAGPLPYKVFINASKQICSFMKFFHDTGRVYSDMKPENIMVLKPSTTFVDKNEEEKNLKLKFIDFGTAVKVETGGIGYTPEYASPEQYYSSKLDERTDIYNIGATFFHMINGKKPARITGDSRMLSSAERFRFDKNVNVEIRKIIEKCVADEPDMRYSSCEALYRDLCRMEKHSHMRMIVFSFVMTLICFTVSLSTAFASETVDKNNNENLYREYVANGLYAEAVNIDHTNRDNIYINLIESFTDDEKLDAKEDAFINNNIKYMGDTYIKETDDNYGKIMYEIGLAYWLYYYPVYNKNDEYNDTELEEHRINASYEWFEKAKSDENFRETNPNQFNRANTFYNISKVYREIDRKGKEGEADNAYYMSIWQSISELKNDVDDTNEAVSARACQTLLNFISRYALRFNQSGVSYEEQTAIINQIYDRVYNKDNEIVYVEKMYQEMAEKFNIEAVRSRIDMAYAD
ncbi:MAG: serine/threonine protein kinase [Ruminococcus sp.]|nr:serine/threonine protein kinase [Ruminococcus sp.]